MNKHLLSTAILIASSALPLWASAETVKVEMTAKEVDIAIDNAGTTHRMWTYDGAIPGPVVRVK